MTYGQEPEIPFYKRLQQNCKDGIAPLKTAVVHPVAKASLEGAIKAGKTPKELLIG